MFYSQLGHTGGMSLPNCVCLVRTRSRIKYSLSHKPTPAHPAEVGDTKPPGKWHLGGGCAALPVAPGLSLGLQTDGPTSLQCDDLLTQLSSPDSAVLGITIASLVSLCGERSLALLGCAGSDSCPAEGAVQPQLELPSQGHRYFWFCGLTCAVLSTVTGKC